MGALAGLSVSSAAAVRAAAQTPRTILLRSSWQTVNIGDIGHTPGLLHLIEKHLPEVQTILWPVNIEDGVEELLRERFPKLRIVKGSVEGAGRSGEVREAFDEADLMLHGSGPSIVAANALEQWRKVTDKPYGIYGVTVEELTPETAGLIRGAAFMYCRETSTLRYLMSEGVSCPALGFAPDATFAIDLRDDAKAADYLKAHDLKERQFLCVVPRLRYTPYWKFRKSRYSEDETRRRDEVNAATQEPDHAKLREAIVAWVRKTGQKVLVCPEMTYQLEIIGPLVVDRLPADVKPLVVARDSYWMPDEAGSVYAKAAAVLSIECHSPIIALAQGTPAIHVRQPTDTRKGQMYRDVGLPQWLFEIDETSGEQLGEAVLMIHADYPAALRTVAEMQARVKKIQAETMAVVGRAAGAA